jgi:hypothetical protein
MSDYDYFELRRLSDDLVYQFDRTPLPDGTIGYKRRDRDLWIVYRADLGWVAYNDDGSLAGRSWNVLPQVQGDYPPEGEWVSKKGVKSYVYELIYCSPLA